MCFFAWLFNADGDLALTDPKGPVLEREREGREFGQDLKEGCKENPRLTPKLVALVPSLSPLSRY